MSVLERVDCIMAKEAGVSALCHRHCVPNLTEMVWKLLKHHTRPLSVHTGQPAKVVDFIPEMCHSKIANEHRGNYVKH